MKPGIFLAANHSMDVYAASTREGKPEDLLLSMCAALPSHASAAEYYSIKQAMIEAIDAPDGTLGGRLSGPIAERFAVTTGSKKPVIFKITTEYAFPQEGCKRFNAHLSQDDVPKKDGSRTTFDFSYGINLCRDGSPAPMRQVPRVARKMSC